MSTDVRRYLTSLTGTRVQLIRRPGAGRDNPSITLFHALLGPRGATVRRAQLHSLEELGDFRTPEDLDRIGFEPWAEPLWFVCTNGRRDMCCAVKGRAVTSALAREWPEGTWETTHLGGHRWAATLLALPSGLMLGRLTPDIAPGVCRLLDKGMVHLENLRGRAGLRQTVQAAEAEVLARQDATDPSWAEVYVESATPEQATVRNGPERVTVTLHERPVAQGPTSCRDLIEHGQATAPA